MKLLIRRSSGLMGSGHVSLYAWDDKSHHMSAEIMTTSLDFFKNNPRPISNAIIILKDELADPSNAVMLHSDVDFVDFTASLMQSMYRDPTNYDSLNNNCVHAVLFALQQAHIEVQPQNTTSLKHLIGCFWCPVKMITPKQLLSYLQDNQNKDAVKAEEDAGKAEKDVGKASEKSTEVQAEILQKRYSINL